MEKEVIEADYKGHKIIGDIFLNGSALHTFFLHGAGGANRRLSDPLRQLLGDDGISSCALDFLGHGETGGRMEESSLKRRTDQAQLVIEQTKGLTPLIIIGSSMGGYNAIKLTEVNPVSLLILFAPAVYAKNVYEVPFGDKFSALIREPGSWNNTDAWEILDEYKGKIIIITGGKDDVVPFEVIQKIYDSSTQASYKEIINIPNAPHKLFTDYFPSHPEDLKMVANRIIEYSK